VDTLPGKPAFVDETSVESGLRGFSGAVAAPAEVDYTALATFRYLIRSFLATSEGIARSQGLSPQQHQCLLAIAGRPRASAPTVGYLADRLLIEHHSAVGLVDRLAAQGLVERRPSEADRRYVEVYLTERGAAILETLSFAHRDELRILAPRLVTALQGVVGAR
jgi:DNA-binding MarR family transcriptional regulator